MLFKKMLSVILVLMLMVSCMGTINALSFHDRVVIDRDAHAYYDELYVSGIKVNYHTSDRNYTDLFNFPHKIDIFGHSADEQSVDINPGNQKYKGSYYMMMQNCMGSEADGVIETILNSVDLDSDIVFDNIQYRFFCDRSNGHGGHLNEDSEWLRLPSKILARTEYQTGYDKVKVKRSDDTMIKEFSGGN